MEANDFRLIDCSKLFLPDEDIERRKGNFDRVFSRSSSLVSIVWIKVFFIVIFEICSRSKIIVIRRPAEQRVASWKWFSQQRWRVDILISFGWMVGLRRRGKRESGVWRVPPVSGVFWFSFDVGMMKIPADQVLIRVLMMLLMRLLDPLSQLLNTVDPLLVWSAARGRIRRRRASRKWFSWNDWTNNNRLSSLLDAVGKVISKKQSPWKGCVLFINKTHRLRSWSQCLLILSWVSSW